jgi:hypothetical protein
MSLKTLRPAADWGEAGITEYSIRSEPMTPCNSAVGRDLALPAPVEPELLELMPVQMEVGYQADSKHGPFEELCLGRNAFDDQIPVLKTWKVKSVESTCMHFNGKECK